MLIQGKLDEAVEAYDKAQAAAPNFAIVHTNLAIALTEMGTKLKMAGAHHAPPWVLAQELSGEEVGLGDVSVCKPDHGCPCLCTAFWTALGGDGGRVRSSATPAGDLPGGIKLYERALAHNAQHADAWYNMGVAWVEAGDAHRAIYCYELAVHFNPHCAEAHNNLGAPC